MAALFDGIPLDRVSTSMTINATAIILLALYVAVARRQGVAARGAVGHDPERHPEGVRRARHLHLPAARRRCASSPTSSRSASASCRNWNTISISGYHIREAGSTAVQEVAFTFANAIAYVQAAIDAGLDVNQFGQRLSFFFNAHNDFLEEIAKFRAARRLWARIMRDRFGATNPRAQQLRFHTQTAGSTLTAQQPDNNIVRVALQALAAVLGGTQSLHCNGRDEALALPTEESARIALRTQQIIAAESGVANTVDPVGRLVRDRGADQRRSSAAPRRCSTRIERAGGTLAAIETGLIQREIQESAYRAQQAIDAGEPVVVGVNRFADRRTPARRCRRCSRSIPTSNAQQVERVRAVRAGRERRRVARRARRGVARPRATAATSCRRSSPPSRRSATVGEIADAHARACSASTRRRPRCDRDAAARASSI